MLPLPPVVVYCLVALFSLTHSLSLKPTTTSLIKPIVKVPSSAWRWPTAWPFSEDSFEMVANPLADLSSSTTTDTQASKFLSWNEDLYLEYLKSFDQYPKEQKLLITTQAQRARGQSMSMDWTSCTLEELDDLLKQQKGRPYSVIVIDGHLGTLGNPLDLFKKVWKLLGSEGICQILIEEHPQMPVKEYVKIWKTSTAEQKLWIAGSYLNYAVDQGWDSIEAVDITGSTGSEIMKFSFEEESQHHFVINAKKVILPPINSIAMNETEITSAFNKRMASLNFITSTERNFISRRLHAISKKTSKEAVVEDTWINHNVYKVEEIYSVLKEVKPNVIPPPARALLSTLLLPNWSGSDVQISALREAVGLVASSNSFWKELASQTAKLSPKDKLYLLAVVVGSGLSPEELSSLPKTIPQFLDSLKQKNQEIEEEVAITTATKLAISSIKQSVGKLERLQQI